MRESFFFVYGGEKKRSHVMHFEDALQIIEQKRGWKVSKAQGEVLRVFFENNPRDLALMTGEECFAVAPQGCSLFVGAVRHWLMCQGTFGFNCNTFVKISKTDALLFRFAEDERLQHAIATELPGRSISIQTLNTLQLLCRELRNFDGLMRMTRSSYQQMKSNKKFSRGMEIVKMTFLSHGGSPDVVDKSPISASILTELPGLQAWPSRLGVWFEKHVPQNDDRLHLLEFLNKIDEHTHLRFPHRSRASSRKALLESACVMFHAIDSLRGGPSGRRSFRDTLSFDMDNESLVSLLARVLVV